METLLLRLTHDEAIFILRMCQGGEQAASASVKTLEGLVGVPGLTIRLDEIRAHIDHAKNIQGKLYLLGLEDKDVVKTI